MKKTSFILTIIITAAIVFTVTLYSFGSCGFLEVPCYKYDSSTGKYDCNCQLLSCIPPYKQGECPNPL